VRRPREKSGGSGGHPQWEGWGLSRAASRGEGERFLQRHGHADARSEWQRGGGRPGGRGGGGGREGGRESEEDCIISLYARTEGAGGGRFDCIPAV